MIPQAHDQKELAVRSHLQGLEISSSLTEYFRRTHRPKAAKVRPQKVIETLNEVGIRPMLLGMHGINGWRDQPQSTQDVDLFVRKRDLAKAIYALHENYPKLIVTDVPMKTRFIDPATQLSVIDLLRLAPDVCDLLRHEKIRIRKTHWIPSLEMAIATKFAAMLSPTCELSMRYQHAGDVYNVVKNNRSELSVAKLRRLAVTVVKGGGAKISRLVESIDADRMIQL